MRWGRKPDRATPLDVAAVRDFRNARAKSESPRVLLWVGVAIMGLTGLDVAVEFPDTRTALLHTGVSLVVWTAAFAISRERFPSKLATALTGACALVVTAAFQYEFWLNPTAIGFGYVLMVMTAVGPILLSPMVLSYVALLSTLGGIVIITQAPVSVLDAAQPADWVVAAIIAEVIGFILLFMRLRSIDELGKVTRRAELYATTDPLTGLYNRRGLENVMTRIVTLSRVSHSNVYACFVDIDWLKTANDDHGHAFGDQVIRVVADAVRACVPESAVIARWGGDEFLVFGAGPAIDDDVLTANLLEYIASSKLDVAKWPGSVSVGSAAAPAVEVQLGDLIYQADERMYARRRAQRSGS